MYPVQAVLTQCEVFTSHSRSTRSDAERYTQLPLLCPCRAGAADAAKTLAPKVSKAAGGDAAKPAKAAKQKPQQQSQQQQQQQRQQQPKQPQPKQPQQKQPKQPEQQPQSLKRESPHEVRT